jgi:hypothetical protein|tara:strand:- start:1252 stop:1977 length:726 start_codon:yes stop_codon:yes gene_type:complete
MFFEDSLDPTLNSLVENKRVIVVGPAYYLTDMSRGDFVDSYDVVVRVNQFSIPKSLYVDYGSRTDIMFHNCGTPWLPGLKESVATNPKDFGALKMVVCPVIKADHSENNIMSWPDDHISACAYNFKHVSTDIPFYWIGVKNYHKIYRLIGAEPYSGIMTVCTLLSYPIKELHITGFDFYTGSRIYHDGALSPIDHTQEVKNKNGPHGRFSTVSQMKFLKHLNDNVDILTLDRNIQEIIKNT